MKFPKINLPDVSNILNRESSETESEQIPESQTGNMSKIEKVKCHAIIHVGSGASGAMSNISFGVDQFSITKIQSMILAKIFHKLK